jgi:hypothetical protein
MGAPHRIPPPLPVITSEWGYNTLNNGYGVRKFSGNFWEKLVFIGNGNYEKSCKTNRIRVGSFDKEYGE